MNQAVEFIVESLKLKLELDLKINTSLRLLRESINSKIQQSNMPNIKADIIPQMPKYKYGIKIGSDEFSFTIVDVVKILQDSLPHNTDLRKYASDIEETYLATLIGHTLYDYIQIFNKRS